MQPARPVSLVHAEGSLVDVFIRMTAAYRAAYDQYSDGSFESTRRVVVISLKGAYHPLGPYVELWGVSWRGVVLKSR